MAEEQVQEQSTEQGQTTEETQEQSTPQPKYTDSDLDKYKGTARKEGRSAAVNELLSELGADSLDALKEGYSGWTEAQEEARTDLERAEQARQTAETQAKEYQQSMSELQKEYALRDALRTAEINPERLDLALKVADTDSLEIEGGKIKPATLETVVSNITESSPEWFGTAGANSGQDIGRGSGPEGSGQSKDLPQQIRDAESEGNFGLAIALKGQLNGTQ